MTRIAQLTLRADSTGTLELVCERAAAADGDPRVRSFLGNGEFGLLVEDLRPDESVTLFFETDGEEESSEGS